LFFPDYVSNYIPFQTSSNKMFLFVVLAYNKIGDVGAQALSKVLFSPTTALTDLNLANNNIGQEGALALSKALSINKTLQHLDLRLNYLGDQGCQAVCLEACKNTNLESLNLSGNGVGPGAIPFICVLLRRNLKRLTSVDLSCNKIGSAGPSAMKLMGMSPEDAPATAHESEVDFAGKSIFEAVSRNKVCFILLSR
jgi:Ran GTPase-activating protein (RanGAP) involved in mRNA processing and transport